MRTRCADKKLVLIILLGIAGLYSRLAEAQTAPPRLLFLGVSKDGHPQQSAEGAVKLRIAGLDISVVRSEELPRCEQADCLASAITHEKADLALTGRILRSEHACLATLWLMANRGMEKPIEQEIVCRPDNKGNELDADLADAAATMIDEYRRGTEPIPAPNLMTPILSRNADHKIVIDNKIRYPWRKKILLAGLGILLAGGIAATATLAYTDPIVTKCPDEPCFNIMSFQPATAVAGLVSGALVASLFFVSLK